MKSTSPLNLCLVTVTGFICSCAEEEGRSQTESIEPQVKPIIEHGEKNNSGTKGRQVEPLSESEQREALHEMLSSLNQSRENLGLDENSSTPVFGSMAYSNGGKYVGSFKDGKRHGLGSFVFPNGDRFRGYYVNGKRKGYGIYEFVSGERYEGHFESGKYHLWGLYVFENFGAPTPETAKGVVQGARALIDAGNAAARGGGESRSADIPQPLEGRISRAHNLQRERTFVPLRVKDPVDQADRRCEHFAEYGSAAHALSYFRGNENIPAVCDPILKALLKEEAVTSLGENLHWKLTLNDYKASTEDALAEAGGALFPWHTDLAANGEITAISTLLAPAIMEFAPHADLAANEQPTRIVAKPGFVARMHSPSFTVSIFVAAQLFSPRPKTSAAVAVAASTATTAEFSWRLT